MKQLGWTILIAGNLIALIWCMVVLGSSIPYGSIRGMGPSPVPAFFIAVFATVGGLGFIFHKPEDGQSDEDS